MNREMQAQKELNRQVKTAETSVREAEKDLAGLEERKAEHDQNIAGKNAEAQAMAISQAKLKVSEAQRNLLIAENQEQLAKIERGFQQNNIYFSGILFESVSRCD